MQFLPPYNPSLCHTRIRPQTGMQKELFSCEKKYKMSLTQVLLSHEKEPVNFMLQPCRAITLNVYMYVRLVRNR